MNYYFVYNVEHISLYFAFRVVYVFGKKIQHQVEDVTPTFLAPNILATLRQADHLANTVLLEEGEMFGVIFFDVVIVALHSLLLICISSCLGYEQISCLCNLPDWEKEVQLNSVITPWNALKKFWR